MMYSCALWSEAEGGVCGDPEMGPTPGDLETAQCSTGRFTMCSMQYVSSLETGFLNSVVDGEDLPSGYSLILNSSNTIKLDHFFS